MIDSAAVRDIIQVYLKHGWILRRVLLTPETQLSLGTDGKELFDGIAVVNSNIDAAWFSRPPKPDGIPWEIRHLSIAPYALLENIDEDSAEFETRLKTVEERLRAAVAGKKAA